MIGGGPAGLSAAINVRARGRSALVVSNPLEENPLWRAEKVDNYLGLPGLSGGGNIIELVFFILIGTVLCVAAEIVICFMDNPFRRRGGK